MVSEVRAFGASAPQRICDSETAAQRSSLSSSPQTACDATGAPRSFLCAARAHPTAYARVDKAHEAQAR